MYEVELGIKDMFQLQQNMIGEMGNDFMRVKCWF